MKLTPHKKELYQESNLINISKNTSEEIEKRHLKDFFKTTITNSSHKITSKSKIFYSYFKESNLYEIYLIENYSNKNICLAFLFYEIHDKKYSELFITENFFCVFQNAEIKIFKEILDKVSQDEILEFLTKRYKIIIDKTHFIDLNTIEELKKRYIANKNKKEPPLIALETNKSLLYFFSFTLVVFLIPIIHFNFYHGSNKDSKITQRKISILEKEYNSLIDKKSTKNSKIIINILEQIKDFSLNLKSLTLKNKKLYIFLDANSKSNLINFVENYKGNIKINKLTFNQQNKKFDLEALIVI